MSTDENVTKDLVQTLEDGREGFARAAEKLDDSEHAAYASLFRELSAQRARFSAELRNLAGNYGDTVEAEGTLVGDLHRGWIALKDALTGSSGQAVINAVTTGEDHAVSEYEKACEADVSPTLRAVIERQKSEVTAARDRVQALASSATA